MKKLLTLFMSMGIFLLHFTQVQGQDAISQKINQNISAIQQTTIYTPLEAVVDTPEKLPSIPEDVLAEKQLFRLSNPATKAIQERSSEYLQMTIPIEGQDTELQLIEADIFTDDFRAVYASAPDVELDIDMGKHYWGIVKDDEESLVTISFFDNEITGAIIMSDRQYTLGKVKDSEYHILYKDSDLNHTPDFSCNATPPPVDYQYDTTNDEVVDRSNRCIRIHIEADYSIFQTLGGTSQTSNYVNGLFAEIAALYANESINIKLSYLNIWNVPSPYNAADGFRAVLSAQGYGTTFGDFVHLIQKQEGSGSANVNTYCNTTINTSYAYAFGYYSSVPTYSWDVYINAHELGHSLGSFHTHSCVWNGNNTAIDRCGQELGQDNSECGGNIPSDGGTIMSYCVSLPNVGVNLSKGFHPQVANVMRNARDSAPCLQSCDGGGGSSECTNSGGLQATYYNEMNFTGSSINRIDATVNFNWGLGSPDPQIGNDTYSVRWEGGIEAPTSGTYTFYTNTDDGIRLWVNNSLIIDKWRNQGPTEWTGSINMTAGQKVNIKMEYFENGGGATAQLLWSGPGVGKQIIPSDRLFNCIGSNNECTNSGGLQATYYNEMNFTGSSINRIDATVNFNWGLGSPDPQIGNDTYSVRWEGGIEAPTSGTYTFYTNTDDGIRLWVNNSLIIDKWRNQGPTEWTGSINMTAGQKVNIKMEYFENGGGATAQLLWSGPGVGKQIIPSDRLFNCVESECNSVVNVAVGKNTSQSSDFATFTSDRANNGNTNGSDFTHTQNNTHAWWEIDLGETYRIQDIKIFNRTDCCSDRLSNFHVFVSDVPFSSKDLPITLDQSGVSNYYFNGAASAVENFNINRSGRYVRVQLSGTNFLQLAEVEVFACTGDDNGGGNGRIVTIRKRNSIGFAIDGGNGGANGQNVYLWDYNPNNINQQWMEIDRGNGYYSYQKNNTNYCIDGGNGGTNTQNIALFTCGENNYNQHWKKVDVGGGFYRMEKRNAGNYSIDGNVGGVNGQNTYLWSSSNNNQNQHWVFEVVAQSAPNPTIANLVYPNPTSDRLFLNLDPYYLDKNLEYMITNVQGQMVDRGTFGSIYNDTVEVDVSSDKFPVGTYLLSLTTNDTRQVIKFVVMK